MFRVFWQTLISEMNGPTAGIKAIEGISQITALKQYYLLPATLGDLHLQLGHAAIARQYFADAITLTQSAAEKKLLEQKMSDAAIE